VVKTVITLVGKPLDSAAEGRAAALTRDSGAVVLGVDVLSPGRALDIFVEGAAAGMVAQLREKFRALSGVDVFIQPDDAFRRKRLLLADMDATVVVQETLDELAAHLGLKDKIAPITERAMRGEIDFAEALEMRVRLLKGLPLAALYETTQRIQYSDGAAPLVRAMGRFGATCVLVSGGFDIFTHQIASTLGFHRHFANRLEIEGDRLTGRVLPPILDKWAKEKHLLEQARLLRVDVRQALAVGDGANDIPMLQKAGAGVGYFAKPAVLAATPHHIRHTDLTALLYMQGYRSHEIG